MSDEAAVPANPPSVASAGPRDGVESVAARPWRDLLRTADQFGAYCWAERRLFRMLGEWSVSEVEASVKLGLDALSHQHAWHGELWFDRLPELAQVDAAALVATPNAEYAALCDQVASLASTDDRLAGLALLVGDLWDRYRSELDAATVATGASVRRWVPFMISDLADEAALIQGWISGDQDDLLREQMTARLESCGGVLVLHG